MRILQFPDWKAGTEEDTAGKYYLEEMIAGLEAIAAGSPIDYILMTGDISHTASDEGYESALGWLRRAAAVCGVPRKNIYICPEYDTADGLALGFYIYEIDDDSLSEAGCIRTAYELAGGLWHKWKQRIAPGSATSDYGGRAFPCGFSILWWTRMNRE